MEIITSIVAFAAGLAMFIYGMHLMAEGLSQAAGPRAKKLMALLTNNRLTGVLVGALVTAIIQSSSATTVMVVGFVNAQIMNLYQAVGVIMGANIGTTMTGWLVSMNEWGSFLQPGFFAPILLAAGVILLLASKKAGAKHASSILIGFGLLFIGLENMSGAVAPYSEAPIFFKAFTVIGSNPLYGILVGAVVTAVIQSSSASMGILQTLAFNGVVNWSAAAFIALGQNIGTCVTAMLSCIGTSTNARRAAVIHLLFNLIGTAIVGTAVFVFFCFDSAMAMAKVTGTDLALFHTGFNVVTTILLFPFANMLVKLSEKLVKDHKPEAAEEVQLDRRMLEAPSFALNAVHTEMKKMAAMALENISLATSCLLRQKDCQQLKDNEEAINHARKELSDFLIELSSAPLSEPEQNEVKYDLLAISHIERISDLCMDIGDVRSQYMDIEFSEQAQKDINSMARSCEKTVRLALQNNPEQANENEDKVDELEYRLREAHIQKIRNTPVKVINTLAFLDAIHDYERISDHAQSLARTLASR